MAYKDLLVVLDAGSGGRARIEIAAGLAERYDAHLIGLTVALTAQPGLWTAATDPSQGESLHAAFEDAVRRRSLSAEWRAVNGHPTDAAAMHGRYADLIILGQIDTGDDQSPLRQPRPEEVALRVGRPTLIVPDIGAREPIGQRVLVAWDASREATRAVNDALPLLAAASSVTVLTVDPERNANSHGEVPGADIALHLARHGVAAAVETTVSAGIDIGDVLLSRASDLVADLMVMGAYGHSRVRELILGGATRTVLASMTVPVLMAH